MLTELRCVDQVISANNAMDAIRLMRPTFFVKGIDYNGGDKFTEDVAAACAEVGAIIRYTSSPKRSAADIIRKIKA